MSGRKLLDPTAYAALDVLDDRGDLKCAWENIRDNIRVSAKTV